MSSHPFKVKAVFEYTSQIDEDLNFPEGQIITVTEDDEEDWYTGEYVDFTGVKKEGIFPRNFVEKYEPTAPPRPMRGPRAKKDVEPPVVASEPISQPSAKKELGQEETGERTINPPVIKPAPSVTETVHPAAEIPTQTVPVTSPPPSKPTTSSSKPSAPPPVSEKPSSGSFRDRIAAFNKSAAPPPAPFKPGGLSSAGSSFIKKPFVAPPPSKDAYVPPPREPVPQKIYRRDEDPEIAAREAENLENAEKVGLSPTTNEGDGEDQPKPTSLKERIALLQKQQMEQAARHADAVQKKEKPKRPPKKRTESHNVGEEQEDVEEVPLEKQDSHGTVGKRSMESGYEETPAARAVPIRKVSKGPPAVPGLPRESYGDGNDADMSGAGDETEEPEESTGRDDSDERPNARIRAQKPDIHEEEEGDADDKQQAAEEEGDGEEEDEEEEEEDVDPEVRRKEELRARMAKMSGGMGMMGMFGGGMPMPGPVLPTKKKASGSSDKKQSNEYASEEVPLPLGRAPLIPSIPLPGLARMKSPEEANMQLEVQREDEIRDSFITDDRPAHEVPDVEDVTPTLPAPPTRTKSERPQASSRDSYAAPPIPGSRPVPPPVPSESRPPPPPPPAVAMSPSAGSESDDEMSLHASKLSVDAHPSETAQRALPPRPTGPPIPSRPSERPGSPRSPTTKRASYFNSEPSSGSPTTPGTTNKRASRVPPIPLSNSVSSPSQNRAPPPPPPGTSLSRSSTGDSRVLKSPERQEEDESDEEVTEYEGDYDTDIASTAPHKDALSHATESSLDDSTPLRSAVGSPSGAPPPLPPMTTHRAVPPPPPSQPPPVSRQSADMPRAAPPPPPPKEQSYADDENEYDPYRYTASIPSRPVVSIPSQPVNDDDEEEEEDLYTVSPQRTQVPRPPQERAAPPPPPREQPPPVSTRPAPPRQSSEIQKIQATSRRSTDVNRISMDSGFVANDVDLGQGSLWWTQPNSTPPVFQGRKDILYETEESTSTKRGGKSTATRDLYVLFQDYSQTVITVRYDPTNPADAHLEQRHEPPPSRLRQDQLEELYERFGKRMSEAITSKKDTVVGDGTPQALVTELLKPFPDALLPVGTRAYGALVYGNLANASTTQNDEIRPGDVITFRNAKFQGKHGPMHAKYSTEVGSGVGHVAVVSEWDGTKKKVRAWEQGRDKKKVGLESFKLDDLRSGEVKIWRVMDRNWVKWEGTN